jgi:uncharacterized protein
MQNNSDKIRSIRLIRVLTLLFAIQSCTAQQAPKLPQSKDNNTLLWEISGNGLKQPSYLFGTFHMMCKDDIKFSANLQTALAASKEVYFEMDLDDPKNTMGGMFFMNMKNKTLKELYTEKEYDKVAKFFKDSLKMKLDFFGKMKPMMLEAMLYPRMMPCKTPSGVEMELMAIATKQKKEIKGFETIEFQSSIFDSIPYETQAKALLKDIDSAATYRIYFNKMVNVYKNQETDKLLEIVSDTTFSEGENNDALLKNRNIDWVKKLKTILKNNNIFIGVGAAHLLGKDGLIALLKKEGYLVKPLQNK